MKCHQFHKVREEIWRFNLYLDYLTYSFSSTFISFLGANNIANPWIAGGIHYFSWVISWLLILLVQHSDWLPLVGYHLSTSFLPLGIVILSSLFSPICVGFEFMFKILLLSFRRRCYSFVCSINLFGRLVNIMHFLK